MLHLFIKLIIFLSIFNLALFAKDLVSLQLQWKYQFQFAGYIIAKEKGFYDKLNLDVQLKQWEQGIDPIKELTENKVEFSIARPTAFLNEQTKQNIIILAAIFQSSPMVLLADKSSNIKTLQDLKNKRIMITPDLRSDASIASMIFSNNLKFEDFKILDHSFNVKDLIDKKTDLIASYISNEPYVLKQLGGEPVIFDPKDYGFDFYNDILLTNKKLLKSNPKLVKDFKNASLRGWEYAFENIEETANIIFKKYNTLNKSLQALIYEGKELKKLALNQEDKLGSVNKEKLSRMYDIYKVLGLSKSKINFNQLLYEDFKDKNINLTKKEKEFIKNNVLKVGISPWYPFTYFNKQNNQLGGVGVDIFNILIQRLNLNIEFVPNKWTKLLKDFKEHKLDILPTTYYTENRAKYGNFTTPYIYNKEYLYAKKDSQIKDFKDLIGKKLVVVKKYGTIDKIKKKFPNIKIIEVDNLEQTIKMVINGKADATFNTQLGVESFLKDNYIIDLKPIYQTDFKPSSLHYFSNKNKPMINSILQKGLNSLDQKEIEDIMFKWLSLNEKLLSQNEIEYINKKKIINVCSNPDWTPIDFQDKNGVPNGISIDILKLISESTGLKFNFIKTKSWGESQEYLKDKKCDILSAAIKTQKRSKYANFTKPYLHYDLAIITKNNKPLVNSFESIVDKKMSRKVNSGLISKLKTQYPSIDILETKTHKKSFEAVSNGKVYFTISTLPVFSYYKNTYGFDNLQIAGYTKMKYNLSIGVRDDDKVLLNILDKTLLDVSREAKSIIFEKWVNKKIESKIDYGIIINILLFIFVVLLFFAYKQYMLRKSINDFEELFNATVEGLALFKDGKCIDTNTSVLKILGFENKQEILGKEILSFVPKEYKDKAKEKLLLDETFPYEFRILKKDGTRIPVLLKSQYIRNKQIRLVSVVDISLLKQQEEQLLQQSRLVSMGEMIGNIAHQWRQPLSVISTSATGIRVQKEYGILEDEFLFEACDAIDNNVQYLSKTIDDFRDFVKGDRNKTRFTIRELVDSFLNLVEASMKIHDIDVIIKIDEKIQIESFQNELNQCFMNIYNNSKDILEEQPYDTDKLFFITSYKQEDKIYITFMDNGGGISEDILTKVFDPYFTTKHESQGTGLGLNMTYNLITQGMNGEIKVQNETYIHEGIEYKGAKFIITL